MKLQVKEQIKTLTENNEALNLRIETLNKNIDKKLLDLNSKGYLNGHKRFVGEVVEVLVDGESKNGEGVPNGSISITSNSPRFILKNMLASCWWT